MRRRPGGGGPGPGGCRRRRAHGVELGHEVAHLAQVGKVDTRSDAHADDVEHERGADPRLVEPVDVLTAGLAEEQQDDAPHRDCVDEVFGHLPQLEGGFVDRLSLAALPPLGLLPEDAFQENAAETDDYRHEMQHQEELEGPAVDRRQNHRHSSPSMKRRASR